jgi:hypothetical protein
LRTHENPRQFIRFLPQRLHRVFRREGRFGKEFQPERGFVDLLDGVSQFVYEIGSRASTACGTISSGSRSSGGRQLLGDFPGYRIMGKFRSYESDYVDSERARTRPQLVWRHAATSSTTGANQE